MPKTSTRRTGLATLTAVLALALSACGAGDSENADAESSEATRTVTDMAGNDVEVPTDPQRVVVTDNHAFQLLDDWGVDLAAAPKPIMSGEVVSYVDDDDVVDLGNHREPDMEALVGVQPDLVINGNRFSGHAEEVRNAIPEDAAFVDLSVPEDMGLDEYLRTSTNLLGEIFDHQDEAEQRVQAFDTAIEKAKDAYDPEQTAMGIITSGGSINYAAPGSGRSVGPIFDWLDLTPALEQDGSTDHEGDDVSVEAIAAARPDWMLVLDRDQATSSGEADYQPAAELLTSSQALRDVPAVQQDHLVYLPDNFYVHEDVILYTDYLNTLAERFEQSGS